MIAEPAALNRGTAPGPLDPHSHASPRSLVSPPGATKPELSSAIAAYAAVRRVFVACNRGSCAVLGRGLSSRIPDDPFQGVCHALRLSLVRRGFTALTPVQSAVVSSLSRGCNLRISSQTGSGKTVALGLALADDLLEGDQLASNNDARSPAALVIAPTRELAVQVRDELSWLYEEVPGMHIVSVTGGTDVGQERRALSRRAPIVVGTPGRLLDHIRSGALVCSEVRDVVLDEADRMLDMGFRDDLEAITAELREDSRRHLVSATFPPQVLRFANAFQREAVHLQGTQLGVANADISHVAHLVHRAERYEALVNLLLLAQHQRCLVFVRKRTHASEIAERLGSDGFLALPFSGDLPQAQRTRTLNAFRNGVINVLVATDVAARGIDVADIATVIHVDLDVDAEVYTHRSGRTGRAGQTGQSILLVPHDGERYARRLLHEARVEATWSPLPTPAKVKKAVTKRIRRQLHARLEGEQPSAELDLEYARGLLEGRDAITIIAHLLQMSEPPYPREPATTTPMEPRCAGEEIVEHRPHAARPRRRDLQRNRFRSRTRPQ